MLIIGALIASYLFLVISNKISGHGGSSATATATPTSTGTITQNVLSDGSTQTVRGAKVSPPVPNAFSPGAAAVKDDPFASDSEGATDSTDAPDGGTSSAPSVVSGTDVPQNDSGYRAAAGAAQAAVAPYCTWNSAGSPDGYISSVPGLTDKYEKNFSDAVRKAWPSVKETSSNVSCHPITAKNVTPVTFDSKHGVAVVNVQMVQTATARNGHKDSRTVSFKVDVIKQGNAWKVDSIAS